jgi:hypothetical protein
MFTSVQDIKKEKFQLSVDFPSSLLSFDSDS